MGRRRCCCDGITSHCRWPCCVYGMEFSVETKATDQAVGGDGRFDVTDMRVKVYHYDGGYDESLDHSHFEECGTDTIWRKLYWGGRVDMYTFGIPVKTEDLLCLHPDGTNVEVTVTFRNVDPSGHTGRIRLIRPQLLAFWDDTIHIMACFTGTGIYGSWVNEDNACVPAEHYCDVNYLEEVTILYSFQNADPSAVCHKCHATANEDPVIKTDNCAGNTLPSKYEDSGQICFVQLPCELDDDSGARVGSYTVESSCSDVDCPPCECVSDTCECGCTAGDLTFGPHYLDFPKTAADTNFDLSDFEVEVCGSAFGTTGSSPMCVAFRHASDKYHAAVGLMHVPFELYFYAADLTWIAAFAGARSSDSTAVERWTAVGQASNGDSTCIWHRLRVEYQATSSPPRARVSVWDDVDSGGSYVVGNWFYATHSDFTLYPGDDYWGAHNRDQRGGVNGIRIPPGTLRMVA